MHYAVEDNFLSHILQQKIATTFLDHVNLKIQLCDGELKKLNQNSWNNEFWNHLQLGASFSRDALLGLSRGRVDKRDQSGRWDHVITHERDKACAIEGADELQVWGDVSPAREIASRGENSSAAQQAAQLHYH